MPEVKFIDCRHKQILFMDFAGTVSAELLAGLVDESILLVQGANARKSVLALVDLSTIGFNKAVISSLKRLSRNNGPYIKAIAFVGLGIIWGMVFRMLLWLTKRRNHRVFQTQSAALDWLTSQ